MKLNRIWGWDDHIIGVFETLYNTLTEQTRPEWLSTQDDASALDIDFHMNHSGRKIASPMLDDMGDEHADGKLDTLDRTQTVKVIWLKFKKKWERLWQLYNAEYDPLENYALTEIEKPQITKTHKGTTTHKVSDDYKQTDTVTTETDILVNGYAENNGSTYGFNNSSAVPTDENIAENTTRTTADPTHNITTNESTQEGTFTEDLDYTDKETGNRQLTRRGQIGVMTYKDMIANEVELWQWNFYQTVMADIDSLLTLSVYDYNKYERM